MNENEMMRLKEKQLDVLSEMIRVCNEIHVRCFLAYGTLLGAVRHQGFIPWDDDIDVFIMWDEFETLLKNRDKFREPYFLQCHETDPEWTNMQARVRDSSTAYFERKWDIRDINHGIGIDVYRLYPYPDSFLMAHKLIIDTHIMRVLQMYGLPQHHGLGAKIIGTIARNLYKGNAREKKIQKVMQTLRQNQETKTVATFFGNDISLFSCIRFPRSSFNTVKELQFEGKKRPCPANPEQICAMIYGDDYMTPPPEDKRKSVHNHYFIDFDNTYTKYENVFYKGKNL